MFIVNFVQAVTDATWQAATGAQVNSSTALLVHVVGHGCPNIRCMASLVPIRCRVAGRFRHVRDVLGTSLTVTTIDVHRMSHGMLPCGVAVGAKGHTSMVLLVGTCEP